MQECSDEQLINSYLKGNEKALEILVSRYLKPIYNFTYRYVGDTHYAEDITQEVFVKMWRNLKKPVPRIFCRQGSALMKFFRQTLFFLP